MYAENGQQNGKAEFSAVNLLTLTDMKTTPDFTGRLTTVTKGRVAETRLTGDRGQGYLVQRTDAVGMSNTGPVVRGLIGSPDEEVNAALMRAMDAQGSELVSHMRWNTLGTLGRLRAITQERMAAWNEHSHNPLLTLQEHIARTGDVPIRFSLLPGIDPAKIVDALFCHDSGVALTRAEMGKEEYPSIGRNYFYTLSGFAVPTW